MVKGSGREQLRPHMPALISCMLESLSSLEDSRLNYIEQHAERAGIRCARAPLLFNLRTVMVVIVVTSQVQ